MGFSCGIVGLPNVGKSTIFNALTSGKAASENFPFCTIDPNTGTVPVPDLRLSKLAEIAKSAKTIPTQVQFVDIAGLIRGASKGEGLGNQFLGHIRGVDAIVHVVRCFEDEDIVHVDGEIDPLRDVETIETELGLADLEALGKLEQKLQKLARSNDKEAKAKLETLKALEEHISDGLPAISFNPGAIEPYIWEELTSNLITAKRVLYVGNVSEDDATSGEPNALMRKLEDFAQSKGGHALFLCGKLEAELSELPVEERNEYLEELGLEQSGLDRLAVAGYQLLELLTFFTAGPKEAHAWTATRGSSAPQCAGKIHTDFEKGFIRAEVISYDDYVAHNGELGAKEAGRLRVEGKEYTVQDGDVVHFRFNN